MKRHGQYYVYILKCADGTYYTGYTVDLKRRLDTHNKGRGAKYSRARRPVKLVYAKNYRYYKLAINTERKIKTFSRKQKTDLVEFYAQKRGKRRKNSLWSL